MDIVGQVHIFGEPVRLGERSASLTDLADAQAMRSSLIAQSTSETVHGMRIGDCIELRSTARRARLEPGEKSYG